MAAFTSEAGAALVFAVLYGAMFLYMSVMYATRRLKWKSRFTVLYLHTTIRVASQACGVAFGILTWSNTDVFVAYLILGAEGYFSLTIAAYYFLHHHVLKHFGSSRFLPPEHSKVTSQQRMRRIFELWAFLPIFMPWRYWNHWILAIVDSWLIPANAIIIAGGSILAGSTNTSEASKWTPQQLEDRLHLSKILRSIGQGIFLALTALYGICILHTYLRALGRLNGRTGINGGGVTTTLVLFTIVALMLHVRGIFGLLQAAIYSLSYTNPANYTASGMTHRFTALEYCLAVMPEFVAAASLNASWWTSLSETGVPPVDLDNSPDTELRRLGIADKDNRDSKETA